MTEEPPAELTDWLRRPWTPERAARPPTPTPASPPRPASARSSPRSGKIPRACRSTRSSSAAGARTVVPARHRGLRLAARHVPRAPRRAARPPPPPPGRSASSAATRWPCSPSAATTWATTSPTGSRSAAQDGRREAAADLLRQLVPPRRERQVPLARLRREQPRPQVDRRAALRHRRGRGHADRPPPRRWRARPRRPRRCRRASLRELLDVDVDGWQAEMPLIRDHFAQFGDRLPAALNVEVDRLEARLALARP